MRALFSLLLLAILVAGGVFGYRYYRNPSRVLAWQLATGAGVERRDPAHLLRRIVLVDRGCHVDLRDDHGELTLLSYVEQNGIDGRQAPEGVHSRFSTTMGSAASPGDPKETYLRASDGYRADRPLEHRASIEAAFVPASDDKTGQVREWLGPAVELGADAGGPWRMLWKRQGGPVLHWREASGQLELQLNGAGGTRARVQTDREEIPFEPAADGATRIARVRCSRFHPRARHLRCTIEVAAEGITVGFAEWQGSR